MAYNKTTKMYEGYIYCIRNDINCFLYIGQTVYTIKKRLKDHISEAHRLKDKDNSILHREINKYGANNFYIEEIEKVSLPTKDGLFERLNELEVYYIKQLNTMRPNGYNICSGGKNWGAPVRPVDLYDYNGNLIQEYGDASSAAADNNLTTTAVLSNCVGKNSKTRSGVFRFHGEGFDKYPLVYFSNKESVDVYDTLGNYIETVSSINSAAIKYSTSPASVCGVCNGHHAHANYYVFRYSGDTFELYSVKSLVVGKYDKNGMLICAYLCPNQCIEKEHISRQKMDGHLSGRIQLGRDGFYYRYITDIMQYKEFIGHNTKLLEEAV